MSDLDIQNLQVKVAFLEDSLSKISDEFFTQQRELDDLKVKYASIIGKMQGIQSSDSGEAEVHDERPPHY